MLFTVDKPNFSNSYFSITAGLTSSLNVSLDILDIIGKIINFVPVVGFLIAQKNGMAFNLKKFGIRTHFFKIYKVDCFHRSVIGRFSFLSIGYNLFLFFASQLWLTKTTKKCFSFEPSRIFKLFLLLDYTLRKFNHQVLSRKIRTLKKFSNEKVWTLLFCFLWWHPRMPCGERHTKWLSKFLGFHLQTNISY